MSDKKLTPAKAITAIHRNGILLVYPIKNQTAPASLWSTLLPKIKMRWVWDDSSDDRVGQMWRLRERLSRSQGVVYTKWFRGRATFFSRTIFPVLLKSIHGENLLNPRISRDARGLLDHLNESSPQSTKILKKTFRSERNWTEREFNRAMADLWKGLLIVGRGEVDDGAFPSLNVSSTETAFESLWREAHEMDALRAKETLEKFMPPSGAFRRFYDRSFQKPTKKIKKRKITYQDLLGKKNRQR